MWIEFGRIQLPQGHHPNDVEKEWGKLIVAMLEREKSLRPEVERYAEALCTFFGLEHHNVNQSPIFSHNLWVTCLLKVTM